jgi:putative SOS response-associated peptidase YedK
VPAVAFYEWKALDGGKQPMAIAPASGEAMAFAGIWENWRGEGDEVVRTFAIVTTEANAPMRAVHDRMPVILAPDDWAEWLEGDDPGRADAAGAGRPAAVLAVSKAVNTPRNNGRSCWPSTSRHRTAAAVPDPRSSAR